MKNNKNDLVAMTDFQVEYSYVEDGLPNVLVLRKVSPDERSGETEPRWTLLADPGTSELKRIDVCSATDDGFEYPTFKPTDKQMILFKEIARSANASTASA